MMHDPLNVKEVSGAVCTLQCSWCWHCC